MGKKCRRCGEKIEENCVHLWRGYEYRLMEVVRQHPTKTVILCGQLPEAAKKRDARAASTGGSYYGGQVDNTMLPKAFDFDLS